MNVGDFRAFVRLTALSELDPGAAELGFRNKPQLLAWYQGQHLGAVTAAEVGITIKGLSGDNAACSVLAGRLSAALRLFPDEDADLQVQYAPPDLALSVKGMRLALRTTTGSTPPQMSGKGGDAAFTVADADRALLSRALDVLSEVVGKHPLKPVLAGTHLTVKGGRLQMTATDNVCATTLEVPVTGADGDYGILPIADMRAALATFADGNLKVSSQEGRIDLTCGKTRVRLALLAAEGFPDVAGTVPKSYAQTIELSTQALSTASRAASVLDTPARVVLKARQNSVVLLVNSQEMGSFQTVAGAGALNCEITLDGTHLGNVRDFGDTIKMHLNNEKSAVMIEGTVPGWRYWLAPIVR